MTVTTTDAILRDADPATALRPAATAMVWLGPGRPHQAMAVPTVRLRTGDVLVEVELATICGSDVHTALGHRDSPAPSVLGHEFVGRVVLADAAARDERGEPLLIGDRVVWSITVSCGRCDRCARGLTQKCRELAKYGHEAITDRWELNGGFATHVHLRAGTSIVRVSDGIPAEVLAPASCGTATAWAALDHASRTVALEGSAVVVFGAGLIGLTASAMARDRGARVVVVDPSPERRAMAARFGAHAVVDPGADPSSDDSLAAALRTIDSDDGPDVVIEASGSPAAVQTALAAVAVGGAVMLVGSVFPTDPVALSPEQVVRKLVTVRGVHNYDAAQLSAAVAYLEDHGRSWPFAELVGAAVPLVELDEGIALSTTGAHVRVGVRPRSAPGRALDE